MDDKTKKSDRDRLSSIINTHTRSDISLEHIVYHFIDSYYDEFSAERLNDMILTLNTTFLKRKIEVAESAIAIASERAMYLKKYLDGDMYTTEDAARKAVHLQSKNAEEIIKACKKSKC